MRRPTVDTGKILDMLGYSYYFFDQEGEKPEYVETSFSEIVPELSSGSSKKTLELAGKKLYRHQLESLEALEKGMNLILRSGTGSGKTESWFIYSAKHRAKTLSVYPTLALAYDQLSRLSQYCSDLNMRIMVIDASKRDELVSRHGLKNVKRMISESDLVVTNPAYLLNEVKKIGLGGPSLLSQFLEKLKLVVVDDFDFYGPREIALIFSMLKVLAKLFGREFQLAFMTAMLANPEEVAEYLETINGRKTKIVSGRSFRAPNRVYIVLGKNLRKLWEEARKFTDKLQEAGVGGDIVNALKNYELFKQNVYKVWDALKYAGVPAPEPYSDPIEIISNYVLDDAVTLVFTRSIERSEEISRRVVERTGKTGSIRSHHHLVSRETRREIEEAVKSGAVRVLVSPRTLSQGIDIGEVLRVVHVGLPDSLREFYQREGRKGRRMGTELTETVIIPQGSWDYDLLSRGVKTLKSWLDLPLEKIAVNPDNKYSLLFEALLKIQSPTLRKELERDEVEFLKSLGLFDGAELTKAGKRVWRQINFYEFGPPYGIKRQKIEEDGTVRRLEDISHCDLVEKFQIGAIDYTSDGVVTHHRLGGGRAVTAVFVEPLRERVLRRYEGTSYALEEYERIKRMWGEEPNVLRDYVLGRLHSRVFCVVHPPSEGFGKLVKIPNRVEWVTVGERKRMMRRDDETIFYRDKKSIVVASQTNGKYEDYTYGLLVEVGLEEDPELLRLGLALVMIVLRRVFGVPLDTITYGVIRLGERKLFSLHEPESAGLIWKIDWSTVYRELERYEPDELDEVILEELDEYAYSTLVSLRLNWRTVKEYALRVLEYLRRREKIVVEFMGRAVEVPKPSRSLKMAAISGIFIQVREDLNSGIYGLNVFDGEEHTHCLGFTEIGRPDQNYLKVQEKLSRLVDAGFKLVVYGKKALYGVLDSAGLRSLKIMLRGLEEYGGLEDSREKISSKLGISLEMEDVKRALGYSTGGLIKIMEIAEDVKRKDLGRRGMEVLMRRLEERLVENLSTEAVCTYISHLIP